MIDQVASYTTDIQLEWRNVDSGQLPSPRAYLRATMVGNAIYLTGGGGAIYPVIQLSHRRCNLSIYLFFSQEVVVPTTSMKSSLGISPPSPGSRLETLLLEDENMQLLPFQAQSSI